MKLEEYLQEIKNCPKDKIREELGIGDNYSIILRQRYGKLIMDLEDSGKFELVKSVRPEIVYKPTRNVLLGIVPIALNLNKTIQDYFNVTLTLHPYILKEGMELPDTLLNFEGYSNVAKVILEIGDYILRDKIDHCLPYAKFKSEKIGIKGIIKPEM